MAHAGPTTAQDLSDRARLAVGRDRQGAACASKPAARFCAANLQTPRAKRTPKSNGATAACSRAFTVSPSADCASRFSPSRRRNSCAGCCAGSMSRPARNFSANAARSKFFASCKVSRRPPTPGNADSRPPHRRLLAGDVGSALPHRRGRLGPALAASGHAPGMARARTPRHPHQRRAHRLFRARRCRLDDVARTLTMTPRPQRSRT